MGRDAHLFQVKGIRDGLLVTFGQAPWPVLVEALIDQIKSQPSFFQGARLSLDVGEHELRVAELSSLRDILSEMGINLWAILSQSHITETTAQNLGLATRINKPQPQKISPASEQIPAEAAKWVIGPLRSGMKVTHEGSIVVLGDVNPGAEIIASGNIIVWGRLRGVVHAGAEGDETMIVCALEMAPTQLRIADKAAISPKKNSIVQAEVARLSEGRIIAEPWQHDRKET